MKLLIFWLILVPESEEIIFVKFYVLKVIKNAEKTPFFGLEKFPGFPSPNIREFPFRGNGILREFGHHCLAVYVAPIN